MFEFLSNLFSSNSIKKTDFYSIRSKLAEWSRLRSYPAYSVLPSALVFPSEFWSRVTEIARHTRNDGHERAVTVWWADGEFVVTENVRGDTSSVLIPEHKLLVQYKPLQGTKYAERIITVNNDVYSKRTLSLYEMQKIKKVEVHYLFNMHTHPPYIETQSGKHVYSLFSSTDLKGFLTSNAAVTGLVTDVLWILMKTNRSPLDFNGEPSLIVTPEMLTNELGLKVYRAEFGRSAIVVGYESREQ